MAPRDSHEKAHKVHAKVHGDVVQLEDAPGHQASSEEPALVSAPGTVLRGTAGTKTV